MESRFQQIISFAQREVFRAFRNTWLLIFTVLALLGGILIYYFSEIASVGFLFLQIQLFLLPLFSILMGCSSAQEDIEELPILFSQPIHRSAFLIGKWIAFTLILALVMALAMGLSILGSSAPLALTLLWAQGVLLSGVFVALGIVLGIMWFDRARGLIASLFTWLFLVFGCDALAWVAVQTKLAAKLPTLWVAFLFGNPPGIFRISALLTLEDVPFLAPNAQPTVTWLLVST